MALISRIYSATQLRETKKQRKRRKETARALKLHATTKRFREKLIQNATPAEIAFQHILIDLRIEFQFQREMRRKNGKYAIVDFYLPQFHAIVEIDGGYHDDPIQKHLDERREKDILKKNKKPEKVLRFTNSQVLNAPDAVISTLRSLL